jgi:hypothetical protein
LLEEEKNKNNPSSFFVKNTSLELLAKSTLLAKDNSLHKATKNFNKILGVKLI